MVEDVVEDREDSAEIEGEAEMEVEAEEEKGTDANVSFQVTYKTPVPIGEVYFSETFDDGSLDRWQVSKTMKEDADDEIAKYDGKKQTILAPPLYTLHLCVCVCVCVVYGHA
ncbi:unnamed protein product, partial [Oncorhynchus mykiss]